MAPLDVFSIAARYVVAGTLLLAAWAKLRDVPGFARGVRDYGLLPPKTEAIVVRLLPAAEVVIGVALLLGLALPWSALAAAALFAVFGAAIAIAAQRGRDIPCHCFGASENHRVGAGALLRTLVLVMLALLAGMGPVAGAASPGLLASATSEEVVGWIGAMAAMTLAVVLSEPLVLLVDGVRAAWRQAPALKAAEAARREGGGGDGDGDGGCGSAGADSVRRHMLSWQTVYWLSAPARPLSIRMHSNGHFQLVLRYWWDKYLSHLRRVRLWSRGYVRVRAQFGNVLCSELSLIADLRPMDSTECAC